MFLWENIRLQPAFLDQTLDDWKDFLNIVATGANASSDLNEVELPSCILLTSQTIDELITFVFGNDMLSAPNNCAILCPTNEDANFINNYILSQITGYYMEFYSHDELDDQNTSCPIPNDVLHSFSPAGYPPHQLKLRIGIPIMLLRNLNVSKGLCNGAILRIIDLKTHLIKAKILNGIGLRIDHDSLPITFQRHQFPVVVAFAMTINKSQEQTLDKCGIYLNQNVFAHGQLYVSLSRVRRPKDIRVILPSRNLNNKKVSNVVIRSLLNLAEIN